MVRSNRPGQADCGDEESAAPPLPPSLGNKKGARRKTLRHGKGAEVSCLVRRLHPTTSITIKYGSPEKQQRLKNLVIIRKEPKKIGGKRQSVMIMIHEDFPGIELYAAQRFCKVTKEGPEDELFDITEAPMPPSLGDEKDMSLPNEEQETMKKNANLDEKEEWKPKILDRPPSVSVEDPCHPPESNNDARQDKVPFSQRRANQYAMDDDIECSESSSHSSDPDMVPGAVPINMARRTRRGFTSTTTLSAIVPNQYDSGNMEAPPQDNNNRDITDNNSNDSNLIVAELAPEMVLGTVISSQPTSEKKGISRKLFFLVIGVFVVIVVSLAVGLPTNKRTALPTTTPTMMPTLTPSKIPTWPPTASPAPTNTSERISWLLSSLILGFPLSNTQERALNWLVDDPSALQGLSSSSVLPPRALVQQFVLAALYYSTNNGGTSNWQNEALWLSAQPECKWYGVACDGGDITWLELVSNLLRGTIPTEIGLLTSLVTLLHHVSDSNLLTGTIPTKIGLVVSGTGLWALDLAENFLTGSIPTELGFLTPLTFLSFGANSLVGPIPSEMGLLTSLGNSDLFENSLTGTIPTEIRLMASLTWFTVYLNSLTGSIPTEVGLMTALSFFDLSHNSLTGSIPTELQSLTSLTTLFLDTNNLTGIISQELEVLLTGISECFVGCNPLLMGVPPNCNQCYVD